MIIKVVQFGVQLTIEDHVANGLQIFFLDSNVDLFFIFPFAVRQGEWDQHLLDHFRSQKVGQRLFLQLFECQIKENKKFIIQYNAMKRRCRLDLPSKLNFDR